MGRRLAGYVPVHEEDQTIWYGPNDDVPAKHAKLIGDHAWVNDDDDAAENDGREGGGVPPKAGQGSSAEAWTEYAKTHGVDIQDGAKRDEIITALTAAGVPTE